VKRNVLTLQNTTNDVNISSYKLMEREGLENSTLVGRPLSLPVPEYKVSEDLSSTGGDISVSAVDSVFPENDSTPDIQPMMQKTQQLPFLLNSSSPFSVPSDGTNTIPSQPLTVSSPSLSPSSVFIPYVNEITELWEMFFGKLQESRNIHVKVDALMETVDQQDINDIPGKQNSSPDSLRIKSIPLPQMLSNTSSQSRFSPDMVSYSIFDVAYSDLHPHQIFRFISPAVQVLFCLNVFCILLI
jgi:hypothetical protein